MGSPERRRGFMRNIQIALTKGRLEKHVIPLFEQIGIDCSELKNKGRKLVFQSKNTNVSFILVKAVDVATYVEHGVADIGIVGKDILMENEKDIYEMLDLGVGFVSFVLLLFLRIIRRVTGRKESLRNTPILLLLIFMIRRGCRNY